MDVATARALVPAGLQRSPVLADDAGRRWVRDLPDRVVARCERWSLELDGSTPPAHGAFALVLPVRRDGEPLVLKLSHRLDDARGEVTALRTWDGRGAVRLLAAADDEDEGDEDGEDALLLERLDASRPLSRCAPADLGGVAGRLVRELAVPAPPGTPTTRAEAGAIARTVADRQRRQGTPVPPEWVQEAVRCADRLQADGSDLLVHTDLTPDNVLWRPAAAGTPGRWVAIDPKPRAGSPERALPELLWTLADHPATRDVTGFLRSVCAAGQLDEALARDWVVARTVDYWLWAEAVGLTIDPVRCRRVLTALLRPSAATDARPPR
ncbi:aminoglycoside phosphotransferase family protein [Kineococcus sp. NPDC059986]|uniref:aminoglycoside phosphotransferase family protein n=1 Tax=Kineococcus sp. NPDC059986 TaxID=3155538 RepID=UPI00344BF55E